MNRIVIAIFALAFVQLVSSQTVACVNALMALNSDPACSSVNGSTVCMETCRTLYDDIIATCVILQ